MNLCVSGMPKHSLTSSSSTKRASSLLQIILLVSGAWGSWRTVLLAKTEAKKSFSTSPIFCVIRCLWFGSVPPFSTSPFFCHPHTYGWQKKPFLLSLTSISRLNSNWASVFLISILDGWTMSLYSSQVTQTWFYFLCASFVCLALVGCLYLSLTISADNLIEGLCQYERDVKFSKQKTKQDTAKTSHCLPKWNSWLKHKKHGREEVEACKF